MALSLVWRLAIIGACIESIDYVHGLTDQAGAYAAASRDWREWLRSRATGSGYGYGDGDGHGYGYGDGDGYGDGYGDGDGDGYGAGIVIRHQGETWTTDRVLAEAAAMIEAST